MYWGKKLGGFPAVQWEARRGRRGPLGSIPLKASGPSVPPMPWQGIGGTKGPLGSIPCKASRPFGPPNALAEHWGNKGPLGFYPFQGVTTLCNHMTGWWAEAKVLTMVLSLTGLLQLCSVCRDRMKELCLTKSHTVFIYMALGVTPETSLIVLYPIRAVYMHSPN